MANDVVIDKAHPSAERSQLVNDLGDRAEAVASAEHGSDGAEGASVGATTGRLHDVDRQVPVGPQQVSTGHRQTHQVMIGLGLVARLEAAGPQVSNDLAPHRLGLTDHNGVGVLPGLIRQHRGVDPAQHHGDRPPAKRVGDLVGSGRLGRHGTDRHPVRTRLGVDSLHTLVHELHVHITRGQAGQQGQAERGGQHLAPMPVALPPRRGDDQ